MDKKLIEGDEEEMMEHIMAEGKELGQKYKVKKQKKVHVKRGPHILVKGIHKKGVTREQNERQKGYIPIFSGTGILLFDAYQKKCCQSVIGRAAFKAEMADEKAKAKRAGKLKRGKK